MKRDQSIRIWTFYINLASETNELKVIMDFFFHSEHYQLTSWIERSLSLKVIYKKFLPKKDSEVSLRIPELLLVFVAISSPVSRQTSI